VTGLGALRQGLQAARRGWRYVAVVWLLDLVVAALLVLPFVLVLDGAAAWTGNGETLAARFDERFFAEVAAAHPALRAHWDLRLALCAGAAVLLHGFLAGGLVEILARRGARGEPRPPAVRALLAACLPRAGRTIAISVIAGMVLALVGALLHGVLGERVEAWSSELTRERTRLALALAPGVVYLLVIAVLATWADLARSCAVLGDLDVLPAIGRGARILWRRARALVALGCAALAVQVAGLCAFVGLDAVVPQGRWGGIVLVIVAAQGLMLWRHGVRVAVIAATARLCRDDFAEAGAGPAGAGDFDGEREGEAVADAVADAVAQVAAPEAP
jgi:hypothetical protein